MKQLLEDIVTIQKLPLESESELRLALRGYLSRYQISMSIEEMELLSAPMLRLFLTGRSGFDIPKGLIAYAVLLQLLQQENNPFCVLNKQNTLREFAELLIVAADKQGVDISEFFSQAA